MTIKIFKSATMSEAIKAVGEALGPDALILHSRGCPEGVEITATSKDGSLETLNQTKEKCRLNPSLEGENPLSRGLYQGKEGEEHCQTSVLNSHKLDMAQLIEDSLLFHQTPRFVIKKILAYVEASATSPGPYYALAHALEKFITFQPLYFSLHKLHKVMLVGPPGVGKTTAIAKMAAVCVINNLKVKVITCDHIRAGAITQLTTFTKAMGLDISVAKTPLELIKAIPGSEEGYQIVLIDTPGTNPFDRSEVRRLAEWVLTIQQTPILVLPANGHALDMVDMAQSFHSLGATRLIITRLDVTRRLGGILSAAEVGKVKLSGFSDSPIIADSILEAQSSMLASLMLTYSDSAGLIGALDESGIPHRKAI